MTARNCAEPGCIALRLGDSEFCYVHRLGRQVFRRLEGEKCQTCHEPIDYGQWVTRASIDGCMVHIQCPANRVGGPGKPRRRARQTASAGPDLFSSS